MSSPLRRWRDARPATVLPLDAVRRRLELTIAAMYGRPLRIAAAGTETAGDIALPPRLGMLGDVTEAIARYRLLALAQAARHARGSSALPATADALEQDLYLIAESAAAERDVVARAPKLAPALRAIRAAELSARRKAFRLTPAELRVEWLLRALLASPPDAAPEGIPSSASPDESHAWAESTAREIRQSTGGAPHYRPLNPMTLWGLAWSARAVVDDVMLGGGGGGGRPDPSAAMQEDEAGTRRGESQKSDGGQQSGGDD